MTKQFTPEQLNAIKVINRNALISAGAGSGKTTVLTERVIRLISRENDPISIDEMLVMTFTKLAAENMKIKIREELGKDSKFDNELKKIDSSYICTFDSFTSSLVKKYNYLLNVSKDINVMPNNIEKAKKKEIIQNIFEKKFVDKDKDFLRLVDSYCFKDDHELQNIIINLSYSLDKKVDKIEYLKNYFNNVYTHAWYEKIKNEYQECINKTLNKMRVLADKVLAAYVEESKGYYANKEKLELLTSETEYCALKELATDFSFSRKSKTDTDESYDNLKDLFNKELKVLRSLLSYETLDQAVSMTDDEIDSIHTIVDILLEIEEKLDQYKQENQVFTFADINKMAISLLKKNPDICKEVKDSFKIIMIDEYQDTSDVQDELVNLIANDNVYMVGDVKQSIYRFRNANPNIFKKRYDTYETYDENSSSTNGAVIDLLKNFRSRKEVVDNINKIFERIMSDQLGGADYKKSHMMLFGNEKYEENKASQDYNMDIINYNDIQNMLSEQKSPLKKEEIEAIIVAKDIQKRIDNHFQIFDGKVLRDCRKSDFCIICDATKYFETYRKIFEYYKIPLKVCRKEKLNNGYDLKVFVNIMNFILMIKNGIDKTNINDFKYYFTSIARSFVCKYKDEYIYDLVKSDNLIEEDEIYKKSALIAKNLDLMSAKEFVQSIIDNFDIYNAYLGYDSIEKAYIEFEYLLNTASTLESIGLDIQSIVDYFAMINEDDSLKEEYEVNVGQNDAVTLINTHLSKGLEYSVCYFIDLNHEYFVVDNKTKIVLDDDYGFVYYKQLDSAEKGTDKAYKYLYKNKELRECISEKIRLFYVALTRTKEKMIFVDAFDPDKLEEIDDCEIDECKIKAENHHDLMCLVYTRLANRIFDCKVDLNEFNDKYKYVDNSKVELDKEILKDGKLIETNELKVESNKIDEEKVRFSKKKNEIIDANTKKKLMFGEEIHYYLEMLDFSKDKESIYNYIDNLNAEVYIKQKLKAFINSDLTKDIQKAIAYKEHEFIIESRNDDENDAIGIIDLLLEYEDKFVIIDYKLKNIEDEAYHKQLEGYANYLRGNNEKGKMIEAYLYSILDEKYEKII